jgi:hypothetical protein
MQLFLLFLQQQQQQQQQQQPDQNKVQQVLLAQQPRSQPSPGQPQGATGSSGRCSPTLLPSERKRSGRPWFATARTRQALGRRRNQGGRCWANGAILPMTRTTTTRSHVASIPEKRPAGGHRATRHAHRNGTCRSSAASPATRPRKTSCCPHHFSAASATTCLLRPPRPRLSHARRSRVRPAGATTGNPAAGQNAPLSWS